MNQQVNIKVWDFSTLNPDTPPRKSVAGLISIQIYHRHRNGHLKRVAWTPPLGATVIRAPELTSSTGGLVSDLTSTDGGVVVRLKVPNPLPPGTTWERMTSEKKTKFFSHFSSTAAGSSPCDEKGASVHVRCEACGNVNMVQRNRGW